MAYYDMFSVTNIKKGNFRKSRKILTRLQLSKGGFHCDCPDG
jgi:hypothetical protein